MNASDQKTDMPVELEFTALCDDLQNVRAAAHKYAILVGFDDNIAAKITLAITEAFTNIIRHGYGGQCKDNKIKILFDYAPDNKGLKIVTRDYGCQVDIEQIKSRDLEDIRPGGLGVHIIKTVMDFVEYKKAEGKGMILTMIKYL